MAAEARSPIDCFPEWFRRTEATPEYKSLRPFPPTRAAEVRAVLEREVVASSDAWKNAATLWLDQLAWIDCAGVLPSFPGDWFHASLLRWYDCDASRSLDVAARDDCAEICLSRGLIQLDTRLASFGGRCGRSLLREWVDYTSTCDAAVESHLPRSNPFDFRPLISVRWPQSQRLADVDAHIRAVWQGHVVVVLDKHLPSVLLQIIREYAVQVYGFKRKVYY